jgi:hypothetical protein
MYTFRREERLVDRSQSTEISYNKDTCREPRILGHNLPKVLLGSIDWNSFRVAPASPNLQAGFLKGKHYLLFSPAGKAGQGTTCKQIPLL